MELCRYVWLILRRLMTVSDLYRSYYFMRIFWNIKPCWSVTVIMWMSFRCSFGRGIRVTNASCSMSMVLNCDKHTWNWICSLNLLKVTSLTLFCFVFYLWFASNMNFNCLYPIECLFSLRSSSCLSLKQCSEERQERLAIRKIKQTKNTSQNISPTRELE